MTAENRAANRLAREKSPYLLQHAYNPVDWFPWGEEAFAKAKEEDMPVFLSIGYSTCHWCHVMERESFEDEEVAAILDKHYIAIKVDREERPDIDQVYMSFCQAMTGHGGWPLTIVMTPEKKPFFAGTYFPKTARRGMPGLIWLLNRIAELWQQRRDELLQAGEEISRFLKPKINSEDKGELSRQIIEQGFALLSRSFDPTHGGFGTAPKFPAPHNLTFLLRYGLADKNKKAWQLVEKTLTQMYKGGIFDHIGYGFARYSTDRQWLVPHFEKMLYDNALLTIAYLETYQATGKELFRQVAEQIMEYVLRDLTAPEGAFFSAEDADSEGEEGKFYLWGYQEVEEILGTEAAEKYCRVYGLSQEGNFAGRNIPNLLNTDPDKLTAEEKEFLMACRKRLYEEREKRVRPFKDDKVLTAWNGLMIAALALAGRILGQERYRQAAAQAYDFIKNNLIRENGRLYARYRKGEAAYDGYLEDYAFLIWGLIELYQASFQPEYLEQALALTEVALQDFWDSEDQGFYMTGSGSEELLFRPKEVYDGAMPSGNSVMAFNMLRLAALTGKEFLAEKAQKLMQAFVGMVQE